MRDYLKMTRVWPCLVLTMVLLAGCPREPKAVKQGGSAASGRQSAAGTATDQNDGQRLGYVSGAPAQTADQGGQNLSDKATAVGMNNALKYVPEEVTIAAGQSVVWTNTSSVVHTVTADPSLAKDPSHVQLPAGAQPFNSGDIAPGGTFRHTFEVPGAYVYFCIPHEAMGMIGRVTVQDKP